MRIKNGSMIAQEMVNTAVRGCFRRCPPLKVEVTRRPISQHDDPLRFWKPIPSLNVIGNCMRRAWLSAARCCHTQQFITSPQPLSNPGELEIANAGARSSGELDVVCFSEV